ncbi:putative peptidoglycan lipid II flippase [Roseibium hamelinense]|uniref:Probable lipid II flippase MurJ n=1 Tax=Roseibium hamelinense TaxID=150831 RepID=A0A562SPG8_9HYPH|nr:murein biosynthesis integral membrane protein MurJ [Roseibium hamelinense]MTI44339.1 murein biosynthesis integral membrane protein MurJ [Roseibium hamelinense]TWI82884.1 putative peptidoglycan lipid II flippase [Roseibium hamelinense]
MSLLKHFATVGGATMASRMLGFVRDLLLAAAVGTGPVADAFVVAFRLPNLFRRLFAEGAFNSAFIPLFGRAVEEEGDAGARKFAGEIGSALLFCLLVLTALAQIFMPAVVWALAPGFVDDPEKFDLTVMMARIAFPYLIFMSLLAYIGGILNTYQRFAAAALAPVMLNVVMSMVLGAVLVFGVQDNTTLGIILTAGVTFGGIVQLTVVVLDLRRLGFSIPVFKPRYTKSAKRLLFLGIPGILAGGVTQINVAVGQIIASMQAGANSMLYYADRLYQLPLGVIGIAIGVVLLPSLTRQLRSGAHDDYQRSLNNALEFSLVLTLPAAVALAVVPHEIVRVLFERGEFGELAVNGTAAALAAFAFGLPAFVLNKVFSPGYFAREDTKTPMIFAAIGMVVNVALSIALFPALQHVGIALATTIAGWVNTGLLIVVLWRRGHFAPTGRLMRKLSLVLASSLAMGAAIHFAAIWLQPYLAHKGFLTNAPALLCLVLIGMLVFAFCVQLSGGSDLISHARSLKRRNR